MNKDTKKHKQHYFAAANGFGGFKSYFDEVFCSEKFEKIYVLKGGPGTGKSSLMKKISVSLLEYGCAVEEIHCSSDPHSLDGVIVEYGGKRIAVLDGTAPHERDAVIGGAIDELVNLGDGWDESWLKAKKEDILKLSSEKKKAYATAYSHLKMAGTADNFILSVYEGVFDRSKAKIEAERLLSNVQTEESPLMTTKLASSFGRYGYYVLDQENDTPEQAITVTGDEYFAVLFVDEIYEAAKQKRCSITRFVNPYNDTHTDGLFLPRANLYIKKSAYGDIPADRFIIDDQLYLEITRSAKDIKKQALENAERWFAIAAGLHSSLEEIYGNAMNFEKNDEKFSKMLSEIKNILQILI